MRDSETSTGVLSSENTVIRRCNIAFAVICCLMLIGVIMISHTDILLSSDCGSDMSSYIGGKNFADHGFVRLRFLGVHQPGGLSDTPPYYLHYPPLAEVLNGVLQSIGIRDVIALRVIHGFIFVIGTVFLYAAFGPVIGHFAALCGISILATTTLFLEYSTSIHTHAYNMLYMGMFFFFFFRGLLREKSTAAWVACWVVLFLNSLTSFEFILYPFVFASVYILVEGKIGRYWRLLLILGLAPVAGVGLHFLQNCWAIGWTAAIADKMGFGIRGGGLGASDLAALRKLPTCVMNASIRQLHVRAPCLLILSGVLVSLRRQIFPNEGANVKGFVLGLMAASGAWYVFMPEFTVSHRCTSEQLLPLFVAVIGVSVSIILSSLTKKITSRPGRVIAVGTLILTILLYQAYHVKPRLTNTRGLAQRLPRVIGPEALPSNASFVSDRELRWSFGFFCKRSAVYLPKEQQLTQDFILSIERLVGNDSPFRYFLYLGEDEFTQEPRFHELAGQFTGKAKYFRSPTSDLPAVLILFDIGPLAVFEVSRSPIDPEVKNRQLQGIFTEWEIPGFDQRLAEEFAAARP